MRIVHVTMSKGNKTAYLNRWEEASTDDEGYLGTGWGWSFSIAKALRFTSEHGLKIASILMKKQESPGIVYGIHDVGELFTEEE